MSTPFEKRIANYVKLKYQWNEMFNLISEFIISPMLPNLIDVSNKVHEVYLVKDDNSQVVYLRLLMERDKKSGIWNKIVRFFSPMQTVVKIRHGGGTILL